jgi:fumarate reductase flavoprotein subunit
VAGGRHAGHDSLEAQFHDTVAGGDWLCEQDVVEYFVAHSHEEMVQMEHWGCPWSRTSDGHANVRAFGGMKIERTWFAADKTGFHMLHTLFQTSIKYPSIRRLDEHFVVDLVVADGRVQGVVAIELASGEFKLIQAKAVIIATGGAGRVFRENTNGGIVTGDGMALAYRHGVPLRAWSSCSTTPRMPGTACSSPRPAAARRFLLNKDGYATRDFGSARPRRPRNKAMELGPRDRLADLLAREAKGARRPAGALVHLDLRHLGEKCANACRRSTAAENAWAWIRPERSRAFGRALHGGGITARCRRGPGCSVVNVQRRPAARTAWPNSLTELIVFSKVGRRGGVPVGAEGSAAKIHAGRGRARRYHIGAHRYGTHRSCRGWPEHGLRHLPHGRHDADSQASELRSATARAVDDHSSWNTDWLLAIDSATCSVGDAFRDRHQVASSHQQLDSYEQRATEPSSTRRLRRPGRRASLLARAITVAARHPRLRRVNEADRKAGLAHA